jgi:hypothetical protein
MNGEAKSGPTRQHEQGRCLFKNHPIECRYDPELAGRLPLISFMTAAELKRLGDSAQME